MKLVLLFFIVVLTFVSTAHAQIHCYRRAAYSKYVHTYKPDLQVDYDPKKFSAEILLVYSDYDLPEGHDRMTLKCYKRKSLGASWSAYTDFDIVCYSGNPTAYWIGFTPRFREVYLMAPQLFGGSAVELKASCNEY